MGFKGFKFDRVHLRVDPPKVEIGEVEGSNRWINKDLAPIAREDRKWGIWSLVAYWVKSPITWMNGRNGADGNYR